MVLVLALEFYFFWQRNVWADEKLKLVKFYKIY
jgi:hypothetical protein